MDLTDSAKKLLTKVRCANPDTRKQRLELLTGLVHTMSSYGYTEYEPLYHYNGRHQNVTLTLTDNPCVKCSEKSKICYSFRTGIVTKGCLGMTCPAVIFRVDTDEMANLRVLDYETLDTRRSAVNPHRQPRGGDHRTLSSLCTIAKQRGLSLAVEIFKQHQGGGGGWGEDGPTDVYDGTSWWFYDENKFIWRHDKSGTHIHETVVKTVRRVWGGGGSASTVNEQQVCEELVHDMNVRRHRQDIVADCQIAFIDREFKNRLDANMSLIGCKNGVYDFNERKLRQGRPSDYITMSTNRTFIDRDVSFSDIVPISAFMKDILIDDEVIDCVLSMYCLALRGTPQHKFWLWTGNGANGKSKLASLLRKTGGDYTFNLPVQVVTSKRIENGKPMPELMRAKNRRFATISEPCVNEVLNAGAIKEMTGGDAMYSRGLYDDGAEMTCHFCPVLLCNDKPTCNDQSEGMGRRLCVVNFPVHFKQYPDMTKYPYERKLDDGVDAMIEKNADIFLTWCLTAGIEYVERMGMRYPDSVVMETREYRTDCDWVTQFKEEFIQKTSVKTDILRWNTVLKAATAYFKAHHTGRMRAVKDLRKEFERAMGEKLHNWQWEGWTLPSACTAAI